MRILPYRRAMMIRGEPSGRRPNRRTCSQCKQKTMSFRESIAGNRNQLGEKLDIINIGLIMYSAITTALKTISGLSPGARSFLATPASP